MDINNYIEITPCDKLPDEIINCESFRDLRLQILPPVIQNPQPEIFRLCMDVFKKLENDQPINNESVSDEDSEDIQDINTINTDINTNILKVLSNSCPTKLSDILKIFNLYDLLYNQLDDENKYIDFADIIFECINTKVVKINVNEQDKKDNCVKIYKDSFNKWTNDENILPFYFFNTPNNGTQRVTSNNDRKHVLTLKIKNEDLNDDLLTLFMIIKIPDSEYFLLIKCLVINDPYCAIRSDPIFKKYFNKFIQQSDEINNNKIYDSLVLRDLCLDSFNGMKPNEYIDKVMYTISHCNGLCNGNCESELPISSELNCQPCTESAHYIQKFAKYCFHTKYLIILHTIQDLLQVCLFLIVILVRCNNSLCRKFLNTLPHILSSAIIFNAGIGDSTESKTEANLNTKIPLKERVNHWKNISTKYKFNLTKLIDRASELCNDDENKSSPFGDSNAEKERTKKLIGFLEKIGTSVHILKIHSKLIMIIENARNIFCTKDSGINPDSIQSIQDVIRLLIQRDGCLNFENNNTLYGCLLTKSVKDYLSEFVEFERSIREKIWSISHGQLGVKKLIWQYIVNYVTSCSLTSVKRPILLIGPPGVGKTFISMCLARILCFEPDEKPTDEEVQKCVVIISTPSISSESALFGTSFVYVGAVPGQITSALLFRAQLGRIVLVIDEIDKPCKYVEQMLSLFDMTQNHSLTDNYLESHVDGRLCACMIATANDESRINPIIKDRMIVIKVSGYSVFGKIRLIKDHMIPTLLKSVGLPKDLICIPDSVLEDIIIGRTLEAGVRAIKNLIIDIINNVALAISTSLVKINTNVKFDKNANYGLTDNEALDISNIDENDIRHNLYCYTNYNIQEFIDLVFNRYIIYLKKINTGHQPIIITKQDVDLIFSDKYKIMKDKVSDIKKWTSGIVTGLYATVMGTGGILIITIRLNKSLGKHNNGPLVTLSAKNTMIDSAKIVEMLVRDYMCSYDELKNRLGIDSNTFKNRITDIYNNANVHVLLDGSTPKDGPSAGGAFMCALLSRITGQTLSKYVGLTGEISIHFKISRIGGISQKINGMIVAGGRSVVAPAENTNDVYTEIVNENSINCKNEPGKRIAFIYYSEFEKSWILLIRTRPDSVTNMSVSSFDVNITKATYFDIMNKESYLDTHINPIIKLKLNGVTNSHNGLLDNGLDHHIHTFTDISTGTSQHIKLLDIMNNYFTVICMENIFDIYKYLVLSKRIYEPQFYNETDFDYSDITWSNDKIQDEIHYDGIEKPQSSTPSIQHNKEDKDNKDDDEDKDDE